jgi:hypothetical protein
MPHRVAIVLLAGLILLAGLASPPRSRADGDPASDYLTTIDIYTPIDPPPSKALRTDLDNLVFAAKRRGYLVKVALIGTRTDLGAVPQLFGKPQTYARFLGSELRFNYNGRLLIVMPKGFGTRNVPKGEAQALSGVTIGGPGPDALVRAGMAAVRAGAAAAGVKLPVLKPTPVDPAAPPPEPSNPPIHTPGSAPAPGSQPANPTAKSSKGLPILGIAAGVLGVILTAGAGLLALRRPRDPSHAEG